MTRARAGAPCTAFDRATAFRRLGEECFDVLVIGGGITGAGIALDASARGLRTALVDKGDFASGTSSQSSKLVHGGLRYLKQREFRLVYEALAERQHLMANAPHLVQPLPFLIPLLGRDGAVNKGIARAYSSALWLYDLTGGLRIGERHRRLTRDEALADFPALDAGRLVAGFRYWDARADDARLTLTVVRTAVLGFGAVAANHARVVALRHNTGGRLCGAILDDGTAVDAASVVNATGVWSDELQSLDLPHSVATLRPAKGIHLTFPAARLPALTAAVLPVPGDRRTIFVIPWEGFTYVGTTDTDYDGPLDDVQCTSDDIDYLLGALNAALASPLARDDITGSWAGVRPLVRDARDERTADLSRRHRVSLSDSGMVQVTGGKLTTYRRMAADTVDEVVRQIGRGGRRSPTTHLPLLGGKWSAALCEPGSAARLGVGEDTLAHLVGRYGSEARTIIAMMQADPGLAQPLVDGLPYLRAEALYAVRYEMAWTLDDVLSRRTRAVLLDRRASVAAADQVARLMAPELEWSEARIGTEVEQFQGAVHRAVAAQQSTARASVGAGSGALAESSAPGSSPVAGSSPAPDQRWRAAGAGESAVAGAGQEHR